MPEEVGQSLVARLAEACNAVGGIEKKGNNEAQRYKYVKAADVAKAFRRELFSRGIVVIPDEKEFTQIGSVATRSGAELREFMLRMDYHICDAHSDNKITVGAFGVAMDSGDKAIWKAKTGCLKYFLRTLGIIPDEKDDPEGDEEVDKLIAGPPTVAPDLEAKMEKQQRIGQFQVKALTDACEKSKKSEPEQTAYLANLGLKQWEELTKEQFQPALKWANAPIKGRSTKIVSLCKSHGEYQGEGNCPKCEAS